MVIGPNGSGARQGWLNRYEPNRMLYRQWARPAAVTTQALRLGMKLLCKGSHRVEGLEKTLDERKHTEMCTRKTKPQQM